MVSRALYKPHTTRPGSREPERMNQHVSLFTMATTMWTAFLLGGLSSDYYLAWPMWAQLTVIVVVPTLALVAIVHARTRRMTRESARTAVWRTAFYFTMPYMVYDYIYLGLHQERGWSFLASHWYLTAFYAAPWLTLPWLTLRQGRGRSSSAPAGQLGQVAPASEAANVTNNGACG